MLVWSTKADTTEAKDAKSLYPSPKVSWSKELSSLQSNLIHVFLHADGIGHSYSATESCYYGIIQDSNHLVFFADNPFAENGEAATLRPPCFILQESHDTFLTHWRLCWRKHRAWPIESARRKLSRWKRDNSSNNPTLYRHASNHATSTRTSKRSWVGALWIVLSGVWLLGLVVRPVSSLRFPRVCPVCDDQRAPYDQKAYHESGRPKLRLLFVSG